jgi:CheY-like chemotaxis protein
MPNGGKLTIETNNAYLDDDYAARHIGIPAGQYVLVAISDTGLGVAPEIKDRIFDPFFTTKPPGKGTGLGLSQVYGFVRQSGGHIKVYSEPGHGTTMKVYLPRQLGDEAPEERPSFETPAPQGSRGETIMVVEDDDSVRRLAVDMLVELGYRVVAFSNAASALRHFSEDGPVDMLFTDVVMPEMNGRQLVDAARELRPELKVLFATGYTQNAIVHGGVLDRGVDLMVKPYPIDKLAKKIREMLDR